MAVGMAVLAATTGVAPGAPAAEVAGSTAGPPGQVEFPTHCLPPQEAGLPPADGPTTARITVDDPAPKLGDTVTVTYQVARTPAVNPVGTELPADALTPTGRILLGVRRAVRSRSWERSGTTPSRQVRNCPPSP